jgi:hypothetical protein
MAGRTVHPYRDTDLIDSRAPRASQAFIGTLALVALVTGAEWLVAALALQLLVGLTLGRQFCLPCLFYFEVIQPRFGEGRIEDARPPRFANMVGLGFLSASTAAFVVGVPTLGWVLTGIVAVLALLAATTGLCLGCEMYLWLARLRGLRVERYPDLGGGPSPQRVEPSELGLAGSGVGVVGFSSPYCLPCQAWESELSAIGIDFVKIDISERPDLAVRYGVAATPLILAVELPGGEVIESYRDEPRAGELERLRSLASPRPAPRSRPRNRTPA